MEELWRSRNLHWKHERIFHSVSFHRAPKLAQSRPEPMLLKIEVDRSDEGGRRRISLSVKLIVFIFLWEKGEENLFNRAHSYVDRNQFRRLVCESRVWNWVHNLPRNIRNNTRKRFLVLIWTSKAQRKELVEKRQRRNSCCETQINLSSHNNFGSTWKRNWLGEWNLGDAMVDMLINWRLWPTSNNNKPK